MRFEMRNFVQTIFLCFSVLVLSASTIWAQQVNFRASLNGAQEVPAVTTTATGTAALTLTNTGGLVYVITVNGLSGAITASHFHFGIAGVAGPVIQPITFSGTTCTGTWAPLPDSIAAALYAGKLYLNVHTAVNPGGEIRGQVVPSSGTALSATLEGSQENPAVATSGKGTASLTLSSVGGVGLSYSLTVNGLSGTITASHFHSGNVGSNGPVIKDILADYVGNTARGVWRTTGTNALAESTIVKLLTGGLYLNVHTAANPGGEIRGQVNVNTGIGFRASMDSLQEVPPTTSTGKGTASLTLTEYGLVYSITFSGLSGPINAGHFHNAAAGVNGPVVRTLNFVNNTAIGVWKSSDAEPLTPTLMRELLAGNIYINVHTALNPGGEIRGQALLKTGSGATARYTGGSEVPPLTHTASGTAALVITPTGVSYDITVNGLSTPMTAAHFHRGAIGIIGPVVRDIFSTFTGNRASGVWGTSDVTQPFTDSLRNALIAGQLYLNVHTSANPGGEIRGQVLVDAGTGFRALMTGQQENPPLTHAATGTGNFTLTRGGVAFSVTVNGLSGAPTAAHFHLGLPGVNGPVRYDIFNTLSGNTFTGYWSSPADSLLVALLTGRIYVNVHTAVNPGGEIRGQLYPSEGTGFTAQVSSSQEVPPNSSTAKGTAVATLTDAGVTFNSTVDGLTGQFTASHFHNAAAGVNGPVIRTITGNHTGNTAVGVWRGSDPESFTNARMIELLAGNMYLNWHTALFPGGEIRGQLGAGSILLSVAPISSTVPEKFRVSQNYPNPFNPLTTVRVDMPHAGRLKLIVHDILGREIQTLVNQDLQSGSYDVKWNATDFASGVYYYTATTGNFVETKKMILMK